MSAGVRVVLSSKYVGMIWMMFCVLLSKRVLKSNWRAVPCKHIGRTGQPSGHWVLWSWKWSFGRRCSWCCCACRVSSGPPLSSPYAIGFPQCPPPLCSSCDFLQDKTQCAHSVNYQVWTYQASSKISTLLESENRGKHCQIHHRRGWKSENELHLWCILGNKIVPYFHILNGPFVDWLQAGNSVEKLRDWRR